MNWIRQGHAHVLGDNIPHDGGVISFDNVISRITDPAVLTPLLFREINPELAQRIQPGDFIVAGKNFLTGKAHNNGLYAFMALGVGILCESMGVRAYQGVYNLPVLCLKDCEGISRVVQNGDELHVNYQSGEVYNLTTGNTFSYPPMPRGVQNIVQQGGAMGMLAEHLKNNPQLGAPA